MKIRTSGEGPLVVKLPGLVGGTGFYREGMEAARRAGFRVAALDCTGDRADDPIRGRYGWDFLAEEVVRGLDTLGADRGILWGTSFGTQVALAAAARHPGRVAGLLLSHPPDATWRPDLYLELYRWVLARDSPAAAARIVFFLAFDLLVLWEAVQPSALVRLPGLAKEALEARTPAETVLAKMALLFDGAPPGLPDGTRPIPVSIVAGAGDLVTPYPGVRRLAAQIPGVRLRVIRAAGHLAAYARPRLYHRLVVEELRRMAGPGAG
jgi:pimeloyl-ACP methyl ester carboxylesterase